MSIFYPPKRVALLLLILLVIPIQGCERKTPKQQCTLYAVGDVMLGRHIAKVMASRGNDVPLQSIAPVLQQGDIVFGNLEAVIAPDDAVPFFPDKPYNFHASGNAAAALQKAGFNVMSLANNHALDFGPGALYETRSCLRRTASKRSARAETSAKPGSRLIIMKKGIRVGFLGYGVAHSRDVYATKTRPGIAPIIREHIRDDIAGLRKAGRSSCGIAALGNGV